MPAPGFCTDASLLEQVQATLSVDAFDKGSPWPLIARRANAAAYYDIRVALARRGYTAAQVDQWDDGPTFQSDQGLYWSLVRGGAAKDYDAKFIAMLDRRKELPRVAVMANGILLVSAAPWIGVGKMATTDDIFNMSDRDLWDWQVAALGDSGTGQPGVLPWPGVGNINESG